MKFITSCIEMGTGSNAHIGDLISKDEKQHKQAILSYLKNGNDDGVFCSSVYDFIKNAPVKRTVHCYTDGEYEWDDREIFHFEYYNMQLQDDFLQHVESRIKQ